MTMKEYMKQGHRLNERINLKLRELRELREAACSPGSTWNTEDRVVTSRLEEAPFVRQLERIERMEAEINREIDQLADLKAQMKQMFRKAGRTKISYELVLIYRDLEGMSWGEISRIMNASVSTVKRWRQEALPLLTLPENPIVIGEDGVSRDDGIE